MKFTFENILELEPLIMEKVQYGHEPDARLIQYQMEGANLQNRSAIVPYGVYTGLVMSEEPARFTKSEVSNFGIKSTVGIGAFGFYMDVEGEYGVVKVPINFVGGGIAPSLVIDETDKTITYLIGNPDIQGYEAFRLIFRQGEFAFEFITYQTEGELDKPFGMEGEYSITCIGYRYEIQEYSQPTTPIVFTITKRSDDVPSVLEGVVYKVNNIEPDIAGNVNLPAQNIPVDAEGVEAENVRDAIVELVDVGVTITLVVANWSSYQQIVSVPEVDTSSKVIIAPIPAHQGIYTSANILCIAKGAGTLTFQCDTVPISNIDVGVIIL